MGTGMTPKERMAAAIHRKEFDCIPVLSTSSVVNFECMEKSGAVFPNAHYNAADMAALAEMGHTMLGFDSISPYFSAHLEAAALGCEIRWGDASRVPFVTQCALKRIEDFLVPSNFPNKSPCTALLKAIKILRKKYKHTVPIVGKVIGPWSLAHHLYGAADLTMDLILEPDKLQELFSVLTELAITFAKAQFDCGADYITWIDHVSADFFSASVYQEMLLPLHRLAARRLASYGPVILGIFGNITDRYELLAQTGFPLLNILTSNHIATAREVIGDQMLIVGAINNPAVLVSGNAMDVRREVLSAVGQGARLIAPEAAVPLKTSTANLIEMVYTAHRARF